MAAYSSSLGLMYSAYTRREKLTRRGISVSTDCLNVVAADAEVAVTREATGRDRIVCTRANSSASSLVGVLRTSGCGLLAQRANAREFCSCDEAQNNHLLCAKKPSSWFDIARIDSRKRQDCFLH